MSVHKTEGTLPRPRIGWEPPVDVAGYDRRPDLTDDERGALATIATRRPLHEGESYRWIGALARLWRPLYDVLAWGGGDAHRQNAVVWIMLHDMHRRGRPHWQGVALHEWSGHVEWDNHASYNCSGRLQSHSTCPDMCGGARP